MKNLKDYIGKPFNIICDNKEELDEIVEQAIELNYLLDGEVDIYIKNNYNANCYLSTAYKENLTIGVLPSSSERTEIKASEFISPCFKEGAYIVALKDRVASIPNFNIGCIGIALGKNNLQLDDLREYTLSKYQEKEGNVKSFKTKEEAEAFAETLKPKNAVVHCKTQEEWDFVSEKLGYKWKHNTWFIQNENSCINLKNKYSDTISYYVKEKYYIYTFEEWCKEFGHSMKVEYVEVIAKSEYPENNKLYKELIGKIFKVIGEEEEEYYIKTPSGNKDVIAKWMVKPNTKEAYEKQATIENKITKVPRYLEEEIPRPSPTQTISPIKVPLFLEEEESL